MIVWNCECQAHLVFVPVRPWLWMTIHCISVKWTSNLQQVEWVSYSTQAFDIVGNVKCFLLKNCLFDIYFSWKQKAIKQYTQVCKMSFLLMINNCEIVTVCTQYGTISHQPVIKLWQWAFNVEPYHILSWNWDSM